MDHAWISIIAAIGAFSVALESIYLGYRLFLGRCNWRVQI